MKKKFAVLTAVSIICMAPSAVQGQQPMNPATFSNLLNRAPELPTRLGTAETHQDILAKQQKEAEQTDSLERAILDTRKLMISGQKDAALAKLKEFEPLANNLLGNKRGDLALYYTSLSQVYRSDGHAEEADVYQGKAIALVQKVDIAGGGGPPSWNLTKLCGHVVNVEDNGMLSSNGVVASTPIQVNNLFTNVEQVHNEWLKNKKTNQRDLVIYMHGGLVDEASALSNVESHLPWWLANHIYPIYFVWHSGLGDTLGDLMPSLKSNSKPKAPFILCRKATFTGCIFGAPTQWRD